MKPAPFDYIRAQTVNEAVRALASSANAKIMAGGQTLGPMLNLRLARPELIVDVTRIAELATVSEETDAVVIGATVTHAAIEDGRVPDPTHGFLQRVARGIAADAERELEVVGHFQDAVAPRDRVAAVAPEVEVDANGVTVRDLHLDAGGRSGAPVVHE